MDLQNAQCYEFKPFLVDLSNCVLLCNGEPVPVPPKAFETLIVLIQNRGARRSGIWILSNGLDG
jgi:DNA-binding winged helix-turn-helix (wHTH) protein